MRRLFRKEGRYWIDDSTGLAYDIKRSQLDHVHISKKHNIIPTQQNFIDMDDIDTLREVLRSGDEEVFSDSVRGILDEYEDLTGYFLSYTKRVKKIYKKIKRREDAVLNIFREIDFSSAGKELSKIRRHINVIRKWEKELLESYTPSSKGAEDGKN